MSTATPSILAIVGSLRTASLNRQLALTAQHLAAGTADFSLLDYADVPLFNQDHEYPAPEAVTRVREQVAAADGLWFFTPEYNHYFPGVLKNLIDWLSRPLDDTRPQVLAGTHVAVSGISPGMSGTLIAQDHLVTCLSFLDARIMNVPRLTVPSAFSQVQDGALVLDASLPYLQRELDAFVRFLAEK